MSSRVLAERSRNGNCLTTAQTVSVVHDAGLYTSLPTTTHYVASISLSSFLPTLIHCVFIVAWCRAVRREPSSRPVNNDGQHVALHGMASTCSIESRDAPVIDRPDSMVAKCKFNGKLAMHSSEGCS